MDREFYFLAIIKHAEKNNHACAQFACWQMSLWGEIPASGTAGSKHTCI